MNIDDSESVPLEWAGAEAAAPEPEPSDSRRLLDILMDHFPDAKEEQFIAALDAIEDHADERARRLAPLLARDALHALGETVGDVALARAAMVWKDEPIRSAAKRCGVSPATLLRRQKAIEKRLRETLGPL